MLQKKKSSACLLLYEFEPFKLNLETYFLGLFFGAIAQ